MTQNIFSIIADQWRVVIGILLLIIASQGLVSSALSIIFGKQLTSNEYLSLSLAGWILPASLLSLLYLGKGFEPSLPFNLFILISLISALVFFRLRLKPHPEPDSKPTTFFLLLFFSISILLRLAFVSKAILPSYFDSAQHYLLIKHILENNTASLLNSLGKNYYHVGYHLLTALAASILQTEITKTMLILGQMVLAVLPIAAFFLIKHETKSDMAGIFAISLAAFGWYMPAHAVDWGKYPALMSLGLIPIVLSLAYLSTQKKNSLSPRKQLALYLLLGLGILVSGFIHSRALVIFGITYMAWIIAAWRQKLPQAGRALIWFMVFTGIMLAVLVIQKQEILTPIFDPYLNKGLWITILVLFLSIFAQRNYPQLTFTCILTICFLLSALFIPVPGLIPGYNTLTLLDRPYVEMILYLPLAFLGGLGLAGLISSLRGGRSPTKQSQNHMPSILIQILVIALVFINAFATYDLYPSSCCMLVGNDDVVAIAWLDAQLPTSARIGISTTELKVLATDTREGYVGGDAGIWITPLINRVTIPIRYDSNFSKRARFDKICQMNITHIYVGELGQTFNDSQLNAQPAWYKLLLSMPKVRVYQVIGCN